MLLKNGSKKKDIIKMNAISRFAGRVCRSLSQHGQMHKGKFNLLGHLFPALG